MASTVAAEMSAVQSGTSAQTLTLGIDREGRILQHDRSAGDILAGRPGSLLGTNLRALITGPGDPEEALSGLIEAIRADRESTTVLTIRTASRAAVDAVVTLEPIRSNDPELLAQVILRIPPPVAERFIDPALMRHALLDGAVRRIGGALDIEQMAPELVNILVPHFCNSAGLLMLESVMGDAEYPDVPRGGQHLVRRLAVAYDDGDPGWDAAFPVGEILRYPADTPYTRCLASREPVCVVMTEEAAGKLASAWFRTPVARLVAGTSMLLLPLLAGEACSGSSSASGGSASTASTPTTPRSGWSSPTGPGCSWTARAGTAGNARPRSPCSAACCPPACPTRPRSRYGTGTCPAAS